VTILPRPNLNEELMVEDSPEINPNAETWFGPHHIVGSAHDL